MSDVFPNSMPPATARPRFRLPHWGWFVLVSVVLTVAFVDYGRWATAPSRRRPH